MEIEKKKSKNKISIFEHLPNYKWIIVIPHLLFEFISGSCNSFMIQSTISILVLNSAASISNWKLFHTCIDSNCSAKLLQSYRNIHYCRRYLWWYNIFLFSPSNYNKMNEWHHQPQLPPFLPNFFVRSWEFLLNNIISGLAAVLSLSL